ncbi:MAG: HesB/IscA family protein [Methylophagaceae bacterium]
MIELTDAAILKAIERTSSEGRDTIRLGVISGGCVGFEYIICYADHITSEDTVLDFDKFKIAIDSASVEYLEGSTLDHVKEGLNTFFKIINPKETDSCGCGVSIGFK